MAEQEREFYLTEKSLKNVSQYLFYDDCYIIIGNDVIPINRCLSAIFSKGLYRHFSLTSNCWSVDMGLIPCAAGKSMAKFLRSLFAFAEGNNYVEVQRSDNWILNILSDKQYEFGVTQVIEKIDDTSDRHRFGWSSKMLQTFELYDSDKFSFIIGGDRFECPTALAMIFSKKATKLLLSDSAANEIEIFPPERFEKIDYTEAFLTVFLVLSGLPLKISANNAEIIESIASEVGCDELLESVCSFSWNLLPINNSNIYDRLNSLSINPSLPHFSETIDFASSNFYQLNTEKMAAVPMQILGKVIRSPTLKLKDEAQLFEFINALMKKDERSAIPLLSLVKFEYLDPKKLSEIKSSTISHEIWGYIGEGMKRAFVHSTPPFERWIDQPIIPPQSDVEELKKNLSDSQELNREMTSVIQRYEDNELSLRMIGSSNQDCISNFRKILGFFNIPIELREFPLRIDRDGVFAFFRRYAGNSNPNNLEIVDVTASSNYNETQRAENAIVWGEDSKWSAKKDSDEWFQVSFKDNFFVLNEFVILANPCDLPRTFSVSGSNDGSAFKVICKFTFSGTESSPLKAIHFKVSCEDPFKVYRIVQNDCCFQRAGTNERHLFQFCSIEFFGFLISRANYDNA